MKKDGILTAIITTMLLVLLLQSCSTEKYVKRQLAKNPHWGTATDTTVVHDTLRLMKSRHDTTFIINTDTVQTWVQENDTVLVTITRTVDKLHVQTVVKERKIPYVKEVVINRKVEVVKHRTFTQRALDMLSRWALVLLVILACVKLAQWLNNRIPPTGGNSTSLIC